MDLDTPIGKLRNLGQESEYWLAKIGVKTLKDLQQHSIVEIMRHLGQVGFKPTKNMQHAIEGALVDKDWKDVARAYNEPV